MYLFVVSSIAARAHDAHDKKLKYDRAFSSVSQPKNSIGSRRVYRAIHEQGQHVVQLGAEERSRARVVFLLLHNDDTTNISGCTE